MTATEERDARLPIKDPASSLPRTAQRILAAAQRLLLERGYNAVTLENIAAEAGVNKASIRYHFGNKAGLVAALVDTLMHEQFGRTAVALPALPEEERLHAVLAAKHAMIVSAEEVRGFFDILPHAIRNPELRRRISELYPWWCEQNLSFLGLAGDGPRGRDEIVTGLGRLMSAVVDGLSVQVGLNPDFDPSGALRAFELLITAAKDQLAELAGSEPPSDPAPSPQK